MNRIAVGFLLLASCAAPGTAGGAGQVIVCGGDEVFIVRPDRPDEKVWSWRAADHPEIPEALRKRYGSTDECKPVEGGAKILITSSGGAVALVERSSGKVVFHAAVPNAHSAEALPGGRIAVASSYAEGGNKLLLFDGAPSGKLLASDDLFGAHGVVWDADRKTLWALGEEELRNYRIEGLGGPTPALVALSKLRIPVKGGHDLRPLPGTRKLIVTSTPHVWLFDRDRGTFEPHPVFGDEPEIKSVDVDPVSGRTVYVKAETSWWAEHVRFLDPPAMIARPGLRLYKARWLVEHP